MKRYLYIAFLLILGVNLPSFGVTPEEMALIERYESPDSVARRLSELPLTPIEGLWEFSSDGGVIAIERQSADSHEYNLVNVSSSNRSLPPGTLLGTLRATSKSDTYQLKIFTSIDESTRRLSRPKDFILTLIDDGSRFTIKKIRKGVRVNLWRLVPYMFRVGVQRYDNTPEDLGGCEKIYPRPSKPTTPIYL